MLSRKPSNSAVRLGSALIALQAVVITLNLVLQRSSGPILYTDELGFLAGAWEYSGRIGQPATLGSQFYSPGYSVAVAPLLWLFSSNAWSLAVVFNVGCGLALPLVLWRFAVDVLDIESRQAALIAAAGGVYPAVMLQMPRAWPEVFLALWVTSWALIAGRYLKTPTVGQAGVLGLLGGLSYAIHHRMAGVVVMTLLILVVGPVIRSKRDPAQTSLHSMPYGAIMLGSGVTVVAYRVAVWLDADLQERLYPPQAGNASAKVVRGVDSALVDTLWRLVGHLWYMQVATLGLAGIAILAVVLLWHDNRWLPVSAIVASYGVTALISSAFLSHGGRVDHLVYGRYAEIWAPLLITIAAAMLISKRRAWTFGAVGSSMFTVAALGVLLAVYGSDRFTGNLNKITIPVAAAWDLVAGDVGDPVTARLDVIKITIAAVICSSILLAVFRRWWNVGIALSIVLLIVVGAAGSRYSLQRWLNIFEGTGLETANVLADQGLDELGFDPQLRLESRNGAAYRSGYPDMIPIDPAICPTTRFFIGVAEPAYDFEFKRVAKLSPFGGGLYEALC